MVFPLHDFDLSSLNDLWSTTPLFCDELLTRGILTGLRPDEASLGGSDVTRGDILQLIHPVITQVFNYWNLSTSLLMATFTNKMGTRELMGYNPISIV